MDKSFDALVSDLGNPAKYRDFRQWAAEALGELGDARAVAALSTALLQDADADVRIHAAAALGNIGDAGAMDALAQMAGTDESSGVRDSCARALVQIGAVLLRSGDARANDILCRALKGSRLGDAADVIAATGGRSGQFATALCEALEETLREYDAVAHRHVTYYRPTEELKKLIDAVGRVGDSGAMGTLCKAVDHPEPTVASSATEALKSLISATQAGDPLAVKPLCRMLADPSSRGRLLAIDGLSMIGGAGVVQPLRAALRDKDSEVRSAAATVLGKLGEHGSDPGLLPLAVLRTGWTHESWAKIARENGVKWTIGQMLALLRVAVACSLSDNHDGTIRDRSTGLLWQKNDDGVERTWQEAVAYSGSLSLAGFSDWRLPSHAELSSLCPGKTGWANVAVWRTIFPNMRLIKGTGGSINSESHYFWTCDKYSDRDRSMESLQAEFEMFGPRKSMDDGAIAMSFGMSISGIRDHCARPHLVRCVRGKLQRAISD